MGTTLERTKAGALLSSLGRCCPEKTGKRALLRHHILLLLTVRILFLRQRRQSSLPAKSETHDPDDGGEGSFCSEKMLE
jgi:hypothetical protein